MTNNYLHDVATGLLLVSFCAVWIISANYKEESSVATKKLYVDLYGTITKLARFSMLWIVIGGVPRTLYYTRLEWAVAAGDSQIPAIIIKHVLVFSMVAAGVYWWKKFGTMAKLAKSQIQA